MSNNRVSTILIIAISCALTFLAVRMIIRVLISDFAYSVVPGWHTTIYPPEITLTALTLIVLALSLLVVGIFRLIWKIIHVIWEKSR